MTSANFGVRILSNKRKGGDRMNAEKYTEKTLEAIRSAQTISKEYGSQQIETEHLLLSLLTQDDGLIPQLLTKMNQNVSVLTEQAVLVKITQRVRERRKELKLTQRELAARSGVSYASLRRFESCGEISFVSILKIASSLKALPDFDRLFANEIVTDLKNYKR